MDGDTIDSTGGIDEEQVAGEPLDVIHVIDRDWYVLCARTGGGQWIATNAPVEIVD